MAPMKSEVAVDAARAHVVVAGGQVAVAADAVAVLPHDQARLAVRLVAHHAVDDVGAHFFQRPRPADVGLLVEARLQLDQHRHLLAVLHRGVERMRDRRGRAHAVERHLDGQHLGIDGGVAHEAGDRVERVVGVMDQHVARADGAPDVGRALEGRHRVRRLRLVLQPRHVERAIELQQVGERREALALVEVLRLAERAAQPEDGREERPANPGGAPANQRSVEGGGLSTHLPAPGVDLATGRIPSRIGSGLGVTQVSPEEIRDLWRGGIKRCNPHALDERRGHVIAGQTCLADLTPIVQPLLHGQRVDHA